MKMEQTARHQEQKCGMKMDLLGFLLKLTHFCFIGPEQTTVDSPWKYKLYTLSQIVLFSFLPPAVLSIFLGMYHFWGQMEVITRTLVTGVPIYIGIHGGGYFIKHWKEIKNFGYQLETTSVFTHPLVQSNEHLMELLEGTKRKCRIVTLIVTVCEAVSLFGFMLKSFILAYFHSNEEKTEEEIINDLWKNFIFIVWLPVDPRDPMTYFIIYAFQVIASLSFLCYTAPIVSFIFVLASYVSMQFAMVSAALADVDVLANNLSKPHQATGNRVIESKIGINQELQRTSQNMQLQIRTVDEDVNAGVIIYSYVRECINMHQTAIRFAKELNDLMSQLIFVFVANHVALLVVSTFQMAVDSNTESRLVFMSLVAVILIHAFGFCWLGQEVIDQCVGVERTAYNILWYNHSRPVKDLILLIILRSQKQVELRGIYFFNLSIDTFSMILNSSYQWLTVLLNMRDG